MTIADMLAVVAGVGIAITCPLSPLASYLPYAQIPVLSLIIVASIWFSLALALATSLAVVLRQVNYRRMAYPAEWVAILLGLTMLKPALPNLDNVVNQAFRSDWLSTSFGLCRWIVSGAGMIVFLAGFVVLGVLRRVLPHWLKTLVLATMALAMLWGPIDVFSREAPPYAPSWTGLRPKWVYWVYVESRQYAARLPLGLLFGVPVTAAMVQWRGRGSRRWVWTEWIGVGVGSILGLLWLVFLYLLRSESPPDGLNAERIVVPVWLVAIWSSSRFVVKHFGDDWNCWLAPMETPAR